MREQSFEKINYSLRPAKHVERKMIVETCRRLSRFGKIEHYAYIGFGSIYFADFALVHRALGIKHMISMEASVRSRPRCDFNKPFRCIRMEYGDSYEILPELALREPTILWLDYDGQLNQSMLGDVESFVSRAPSGSLLLVTVNCQFPATDREHAKENFDHEFEPGTIDPSWSAGQYIGAGLGNMSREILLNTVSRTLRDRNDGLAQSKQFQFGQLFNFRYQDGAKMMTFGGMLYENTHERKYRSCRFGDLPFVREDAEIYDIVIPMLTYRELRYLDAQLPLRAGAELRSRGIPDRHLKQYAELYRFFPNYSDVDVW